VEEIDSLNVYHAGLLALTRAVRALSVAPEHVLVDARKLPALGLPHTPIIHGDALSLTIAAASILAKTTRDALMCELDAIHPGYGFSRHKGYPTAEHFDALGRLGACPVHRRSFGPVRRALGLAPEQGELFGGGGRSATGAAADLTQRSAIATRGLEDEPDGAGAFPRPGFSRPGAPPDPATACKKEPATPH
jgi:ribonuclease HII